MSDDGSFLQRWSRRKQADRAAARAQPATEPREAGVGPDDKGAARAAAKPASPPAEASAAPPPPLPALDTIDHGTDIRPFLAADVPEETTRAALRRAWSTDTAIRDFVGLSENFWDATSGAEIPGFGALTIDEARRLLARLTGTSKAPDKQPSDRSATLEKLEDPARKSVDGQL